SALVTGRALWRARGEYVIPCPVSGCLRCSRNETELNAFGIGHDGDRPCSVSVLIETIATKALDERDGARQVVDPQVEVHTGLPHLLFRHALDVDDRPTTHSRPQLEPSLEALCP